MKMCWELNPNCFMKHRQPGDDPCPAQDQEKSCWEFDWAAAIADIGEEEKEYWKKHMRVDCPRCPVYAEHKEELDAIIAKVQEV